MSLIILISGLAFETFWIVSGEANCPAPWPQCSASPATACFAAWHSNSESQKRRDDGHRDTADYRNASHDLS